MKPIEASWRSLLKPSPKIPLKIPEFPPVGILESGWREFIFFYTLQRCNFRRFLAKFSKDISNFCAQCNKMNIKFVSPGWILKLSTLRFGKTRSSSTTAVADTMVWIYKTSKVVGVWVITKIQRFNNSPIIPHIFWSSFRQYFEQNIVTTVLYAVSPWC